MKKVLLLGFLLCIESFAEYEKGKIDMHGGKEADAYEKKSAFKNATQPKAFGMLLLLDQNTTKEKKPIFE